MSYAEFLARKFRSVAPAGIADEARGDIPMFEHQRVLVNWALRRGRCAIFADTGLGKTRMELAWADAVHRHTGGDVLILTPLAVAKQMAEEGAAIGVNVAILREPSDYGVTMLELDKIHCGDNCDLLGQLPRECIDLVVTSPPYDDLRTYGGHSWDFFGVAWQLKRVLKPGGVIVWVVADATKDGSETGSSMEQALHFKRLGLNLHDTMIYQVAGTGAKGSNLAYWQEWEYCFVLSNGRPRVVNRLADSVNVWAGAVCTKGRLAADGSEKDSKVRTVKEFGVRGNVWRYQAGNNGDDNQGHPAVFPFNLARDHISSWSNPGDVVLDPFSGSGTTAKAAKALGRRFIGLEVNPDYCEIAEQRLAQHVLALDQSAA